MLMFMERPITPHMQHVKSTLESFQVKNDQIKMFFSNMYKRVVSIGSVLMTVSEG